MPTDPFVSPGLDDRPRQQQNLPAGMAYPPARAWRGGRPGELGAEQPHGSLFGDPGPNVGYAYTLAERAKSRFRLGAHEHAHDVVAVVAEIAGRRAATVGRAPVVRDVDLALELLGYDGSADASWVEQRTRLVHEAAHAYARRRALVDSVPTELLRMQPGSLGAAVEPWRTEVASLVDPSS
ncbi:MAG TPA: hypothetical protein VFZ83_16085 [Acidimicrobiia bacterium]|nr:hypothetical protein [Acidimicrobiia bacterium]